MALKPLLSPSFPPSPFRTKKTVTVTLTLIPPKFRPTSPAEPPTLRRRPRRHRRRRSHPRRPLPRPPPRRAGGQDHPQGELEEDQGKQEGQRRSEALLFRRRLLLRLRSAAPDRQVRFSRVRRLGDLELKKRHHQLRSILCGRCKLMSHGHMVTSVGGHGGYSGGKQFVSTEEGKKLSQLPP